MNLTDPNAIRALREELIAAEARALHEHLRLRQMRDAIEALCVHAWISQGHVGPYERRTCCHCGATDFIS